MTHPRSSADTQSAMQRLLSAAGWDAGSIRHKQLEDALSGARLEIVERRIPDPAQAVPDDAADAARYRNLKEYCSYHYAEGYDPPTPREFGIQWEWIDTTPARPGMDWLIDQEIEAKRLETLEYEAEEAALALPSTHSNTPEKQ